MGESTRQVHIGDCVVGVSFVQKQRSVPGSAFKELRLEARATPPPCEATPAPLLPSAGALIRWVFDFDRASQGALRPPHLVWSATLGPATCASGGEGKRFGQRMLARPVYPRWWIAEACVTRGGSEAGRHQLTWNALPGEASGVPVEPDDVRVLVTRGSWVAEGGGPAAQIGRAHV